MKIARGILMTASLVALASCSGYRNHSEIKALNQVQPVGSPFTQSLTSEYRAFSNDEMNKMFDYPDALHFARKGLAAARGEVVMPEPISDWNLTPAHQEELGSGRARLISAYDNGAREQNPQVAAHAQAMFDCWIEQQEEDWSNNTTMSCKAAFNDALNKLESQVGRPAAPGPMAAPAEAANAPDTSKPMKAEDAMYLVFFDFNKSSIGPGGQSVIDTVAQEIKSRSLTAVNVVGNTDTMGSEQYNRRLGQRRANSVRDALAKRGVESSLIRTESHGEDNLLVKTPDQTREPANRRAEITFNQGSGSGDTGTPPAQ